MRAARLLPLLVACASPPLGQSPTPPAPPAGWSHVVTPGPGARELAVEASFDPGSGDVFEVDEAAAPFVSGVEQQSATGWGEVPRRGDGWTPACADGCRLRYRFALDEAARQLADLDRVRAVGAAVVGAPSTWLLRPHRLTPRRPWRLRVAGDFVSGITGAPGGPAARPTSAVAAGQTSAIATGPGVAFEAATDDITEAPYSGFGPFRRRSLAVAGGHLELALAPEAFGVDDDVLVAWVQRGADLVGGYFRRLPVERPAVFLVRTPGQGVAYGRTLGNGGASIVLELGTELRADDLRDDWVINHELLHLGFPTMPLEHAWIEEGLATYLEPLLRARVGRLSAEQVWADFVERMPQGQPEPGDQGLDHTGTWGRTYWGGAIFCLQADVEIRRRTDGRRSLDDALRAIVEAGGTVAHRWPLGRALEVGDAATGTRVLQELHAAYGDHPTPFALAALWASLGVVPRPGGRVALDDRAPLARVRQAITAPP